MKLAVQGPTGSGSDFHRQQAKLYSQEDQDVRSMLKLGASRGQSLLPAEVSADILADGRIKSLSWDRCQTLEKWLTQRITAVSSQLLLIVVD